MEEPDWKAYKSYQTKDGRVKYAAEHSLRLHPAQKKLIEITLQHPESEMLGSADQLNLLQNLARSIGAKKTLDIGVYTGYSALTMALALPDDGKVVALDITDEFAKLGQPVWKEAGVDHKIEFIVGSAMESLQKLINRGEEGTYDMAFIDADKPSYDIYYELALKLVRPNGIIAIDNVLWGAWVCDPTRTDARTASLRALAAKIHQDERVNVSLLVLGDGTLLAFKK
jgi:caffeoyl-CoA O-methyltransferase